MKLRVDGKRVEETVTVGQYIDMQTGELSAVVDVMANFVVNESTDQYHTHKEGLKIIRSLKFNELKEAAEGFSKAVKDGLVPPKNGEATAVQE
jgi:hypothetical protein